MEGGSVEIGAAVYRGLGLATDFSGAHASSIGSSGIPLSMLTETFGPRYRWHDGRHLSLYGQGLVGEANGFRSLFPSPAGAQTGASSLATQVGGSFDLTLRHHLATRFDAAWLRTQLPNSTNNAQNTFRLGIGLVLHSGTAIHRY